jgi:large subunit ribosomal protein L30e
MNLVKTIRSAVDTDGVILGTKSTLIEVLTGGVKFAVVASNCERIAKDDLVKFCQFSKVELKEFEGSSVELGEVCGKPFVVSMLAVLEGKKSGPKPTRKRG